MALAGWHARGHIGICWAIGNVLDMLGNGDEDVKTGSSVHIDGT
jgi:hypothetical protein